MRVIVLGAGAIGCWMGARAVRNGAEVMLVGRAPLVQDLAANGLAVNLPDGNRWALRSIRATTELLPELAELVDVVLICTKAHAVDAAINQLRTANLNKTAWLVCFQNGVGTEERVAEAFGAARVLAGTTTTPVTVISPAAVNVEALGGIGLAAVDGTSWSPALVRSAEMVHQLLGGVVYADYQVMKWSKLLLNIIGNASSAILDMSLTEMYADKRLLDLEFRMLREALAVMHKRGMAPLDLPSAPAAQLAKSLRRYPDWLLRRALKPRFIKGRGNKKPSFYFDVAQPNGKSEVEYLNGQVMAWGQALDVETPVNTGLTNILMDIVSGKETADEWRKQVDKLLALCS